VATATRHHSVVKGFNAEPGSPGESRRTEDFVISALLNRRKALFSSATAVESEPLAPERRILRTGVAAPKTLSCDGPIGLSVDGEKTPVLSPVCGTRRTSIRMCP
jgi:hypothetical protein